MSRCGCGSSGGCSCRLISGDGIVVTGSGTPTDPFVVTAEITTFADAFQAQDTETVELDLVGAGTSLDPFILRATTAISMEQLSNWDDPAGPAVGDVPVFNGTSWEAAPPDLATAGAVNANGGIAGDGTFLTPLHIQVSDEVTTTTDGLDTYIDEDGFLRVVPGTSSDWDDISNKPTAFPSTWDLVAGKPTSYPDATRIAGHAVFVQTAAPTTGMTVDDIWIKKP